MSIHAGMQHLWQAVLVQAISDALKRELPPPGKQLSQDRSAIYWRGKTSAEKRHADAWIRTGGPEFRQVCSLAGFDPDFIRDRYMAGKIDPDLMQNGLGHNTGWNKGKGGKK